MELNPGRVTIQPTWNRFLNQATQFKQTVAENISLAVESLHAYVDQYHQTDTTNIKPGTPPANLALLEQQTNPPKITVGTKVLIIGDSQTVGPYGKSIDELARATGATVSTHASWGASPTWFFNGQETYKYWSRDSAGNQDTRSQAKTPLLKDLLAKERPDVVVVTMGGNMIAGNATQADVTMQVSQIGNAVSASGAQLVWVGPPKYDPQKRSPEVIEQFYQKLRNIVPEYGTLIDSRPHISEYAGTDGLHYSGAKGERIARQWANGVFQEIQQQ